MVSWSDKSVARACYIASSKEEDYVTQEKHPKGPLAQGEHPAFLWWKGELVPWEKATVHVTMVGWTAISSVFEGIRGYWNAQERELYIFHPAAHLDRFNRSMKLMRMTSPYSKDQLLEALKQLVKANSFQGDVYFQPLAYFPGGVPGYVGVLERPGEVMIVSYARPSTLEQEEKSSTCCVSTWLRPMDTQMPPRAKMLPIYQNSRMVATEAQMNGYDYGIIMNTQGKVAEASHACVFLVRDGTAITPPITAGILESITRTAVMDLLRDELGIPVVEREVDRTELYVADEVFLCGTAMEVEAVASVDKYRPGAGAPGPVTRRLRRLFRDVVRGMETKYAHWRTPALGRAATRA
ncbi:MAG: branched-chain amino acid transaminase [Chloroflexi bacterium]|nr:branched-chain amino acid transaminase [Chloroflexota bacterium]